MIRTGLFCGVAAPLLWAAVILIAGNLRPGFDHVGQYISELGERGGSHAAFMRYGGFVATGLMHICYSAAFHTIVSRTTGRPGLSLLIAVLVALDGVGRIGAGLFSCEPGCQGPETITQRLHHLSASMAFLSLAAAECVAAMLFRRVPGLRSLGPYSLLSGCAGLLLLGLMLAGGAIHAYVGLIERLASGVLTLWVLVTALRLRISGIEAATAIRH